MKPIQGQSYINYSPLFWSDGQTKCTQQNKTFLRYNMRESSSQINGQIILNTVKQNKRENCAHSAVPPTTQYWHLPSA